ncbi:MAG: hypothetical protein LBS89_01365 [Zoogloeaceae bacterium]|jgi:hypothetical protein|nr:hypothetical protein [Zoogloeaceae bacterium]
MATLDLSNLSDNRYIDLVFNDDGGMVLMTNDYSHYYDDPRQVARDVHTLICGTEDNEGVKHGEDTDAIQRKVADWQKNSGYVWYTRQDIQKVFDVGLEGRDIKGGLHAQQFFAHLHELVEAAAKDK